MGILDNIGIGRKSPSKGAAAKPAASSATASRSRAGAGSGGASGGAPGGSVATRSRPGSPGAKGAKPGAKGASSGSKLPGKRKRKGPPTPKERIASAAAPLHDRRRRLVGAREATLRDLGGLMLEMYKRNRFREELLLDKCEEVLAIEVEIAHVDQRLFQLAPPNAAGMRPIGRCECGAPIHPGQNFCGVCGRPFATLTQGRSCSRCGAGLRPGDHYCATCGTEAPDALTTIEAAPPDRAGGAPVIDATSIASSAVADTVVIEAASTPLEAAPSIVDDPGTPPLEDPAATMATPAVAAEPAEPTMPAPAPAGFDWSAPPAAPDVAIDAALESLPGSPTDPETPFAGFPLTSTVPPAPALEPVEDEPASAETPLPTEPVVMEPPVVEPSTPQPAQPAPALDVPPPPPVIAPTPITPEPVTPPATTPPADVETAPPAEQAPAAPAQDPKAAKAIAKAEAAEKKQRAKAARARAKQRAKAARDARKRGGAE